MDNNKPLQPPFISKSGIVHNNSIKNENKKVLPKSDIVLKLSNNEELDKKKNKRFL
eukprot:TRINITY_DN15361_c1_g1_i1.p2 TRINITY_DN15361_c1_g1~~TRINITY_DN15361_c1_g1_i1.p2  ORF type:complete len:56 (-),score=5.85 TRINITY_DN15361_c1_g1_i1:262-429(-)